MVISMQEVSKRVSKGDLSLKNMLCSLYADTKTGHDEKVLFKIENTRFCIRLKPTLYGLQFNGVYWKEESDSESDPKSGGQ
jgi:hypothetical protein